jgi:hypothetical protein
MYGAVESWVSSRREQHDIGASGTKVPLSQSADWPAESTAAVSQLILGALAGILLYRMGTVTTVMGVVLSGISAPAILYQLGQVKSIRDAVLQAAQQSPAGSGGERVEAELPRPGGHAKHAKHAKDEQASA